TTPAYLPPELFRDERVDPNKASVWSIGVMHYKIIYDQHPIDFDDIGKKNVTIKIKFPKLSDDRLVSDKTKNLIKSCLCSDDKKGLDLNEMCENSHIKEGTKIGFKLIFFKNY